MPPIRRSLILDQLAATLPPAEAERLLRAVLQAAGLKDKASYTADEVGLLGKAMLDRASRDLVLEGLA
ncbi:MAG: hypothetical protein JWM80_359 [Cyanobacteria bacterium RYN_339]|nr:hypothetical protein [Cyanobacteria bacterium RYN_339]